MDFKDAVEYCGDLGLPLAEIHTKQDHYHVVEKLRVSPHSAAVAI
jgi:hypothetical protein